MDRYEINTTLRHGERVVPIDIIGDESGLQVNINSADHRALNVTIQIDRAAPHCVTLYTWAGDNPGNPIWTQRLESTDPLPPADFDLARAETAARAALVLDELLYSGLRAEARQADLERLLREGG